MPPRARRAGNKKYLLYKNRKSLDRMTLRYIIKLYQYIAISHGGIAVAFESESIRCPNCGSVLEQVGENICAYCGQKVFVRRVRDAGSMTPLQLNKYAQAYRAQGGANALFSLGCCQLKLRQFDLAAASFEKCLAEDPEQAMAYYYLAVALMKGKRPFLQLRPVIDRAESCLESAESLETSAAFYYFHALIRYDYFARKRFNVSPDHTYYLSLVQECGGAYDDDKDELYALLGCECPDGF